MKNSLSFVKLVKYIEGYSFGEFFNDDNASLFIDYLHEVSEECQSSKWRCEYGATKLVIIMNDEDIVFKIPFNSTWDYNESDYSFFYGAPSISTWDYCEAEEERYNIAEENGFANYVAKTSMVYSTKNGVRIYTQPKCYGYSKEKRTSRKRLEVFKKWAKFNLPILEPAWLNAFIDHYGAYKLKKFLKFLIDEEWDDDLSGPNIGYTATGEPILIDYSSYMEQHINFQELDL